MTDYERRRDAILLVDDDPSMRRFMVRFLDGAGYRVLEASDGVEAIELMATKGRIGLLISDVEMPGMDGPSMVAMIRRHQADLPILLTSGYPPPDPMPPGVRFLAKPFSSDVLLQYVSEMHLAGAPS